MMDFIKMFKIVYKNYKILIAAVCLFLSFVSIDSGSVVSAFWPE